MTIKMKFNPDRYVNLNEMKEIMELLEKNFPNNKSIEDFTKHYFYPSTKHGNLYDLKICVHEGTSEGVRGQYFNSHWSGMDFLKGDHRKLTFDDNKHFITYAILSMQYIEDGGKKYFQIV
jgi:hypothetical protein